MTDDRHNLIAFLATLGAIIILFIAACICLGFGKSVEAIGIGGVMTGLIGVLGTFRPRQSVTPPQQADPQSDPQPDQN